jgi:hypothetical protein
LPPRRVHRPLQQLVEEWGRWRFTCALERSHPQLSKTGRSKVTERARQEALSQALSQFQRSLEYQKREEKGASIKRGKRELEIRVTIDLE